MAAEKKNWNLLKKLLEMNVDVNLATNTDVRAVNYAIKCGEKEIIELLFKHRTDVYRWKDPDIPVEVSG